MGAPVAEADDIVDADIGWWRLTRWTGFTVVVGAGKPAKPIHPKGAPRNRPLVIGVVATLLTIAGLHLGKLIRNASKLGHLAEGIGGIVLIAIGIKILYDHGVF